MVEKYENTKSKTPGFSVSSLSLSPSWVIPSHGRQFHALRGEIHCGLRPANEGPPASVGDVSPVKFLSVKQDIEDEWMSMVYDQWSMINGLCMVFLCCGQINKDTL